MTCEHRRIKKNFPHGRKSEPALKCKDCNESITKLKLMKMNKRSKERTKKWNSR